MTKIDLDLDSDPALIARRLGPGNFGRIARRTGIDKQHVSRSCQGLREPSLDVAGLIAEAAGVSLDEFWAHTKRFRQVRVAKPRRRAICADEDIEDKAVTT